MKMYNQMEPPICNKKYIEYRDGLFATLLNYSSTKAFDCPAKMEKFITSIKESHDIPQLIMGLNGDNNLIRKADEIEGLIKLAMTISSTYLNVKYT